MFQYETVPHKRETDREGLVTMEAAISQGIPGSPAAEEAASGTSLSMP